MTDADLQRIKEGLAHIPHPIAVLESLFAFAPVGLQIYDASGRSLLVNQAFRDLFGSEPPPDYNVLHDEIAAKNGVLGLIQRAFKGETLAVPPVWYDPRELTQVKIDEGNRVAMQANFFPLFDPQGTVTHVAVLFRDVTPEVVHREELEAERELLSAIIDQVSEGITMADAHGVLRLANGAAREQGLRPGMLLSNLADLFETRTPSGEKMQAGDLPLSRALRGETAKVMLQRRGPGGEQRSLSVVAVPLRRSDGTLRGAVSTFRDETERVRHDLEVQQTAHFRERFIGILGHDLRSPLTAIVASAALLLRQRDQSDQVLAAAARISSGAERMGRMISDLLDFTHARLGGGLPVNRRPCDLNAVARSAVDEALAANPDRVIRFEPAEPGALNGDADRLSQILANLIANAISYSPPGEPIVVRVRNGGQRALIEVENGGPEIPAAERRSLFDPFRRGSQSGQTRGLGLGLFIVDQIARAHGGEASVESGPKRTVFRVTLQR